MKKITSFVFAVLIVLTAFALGGCGEDKEAENAELKYGTYVRQNDDFGTFSITINKDGTFSYYETAISSYIGMGNYTVDDGVLTLKDEQSVMVLGTDRFPYFYRIYGDELIENGEDVQSYEQLHTVSGTATLTFRFKIAKDKLIYIADGSDNFMYEKLSDGAEFNYEVTKK